MPRKLSRKTKALKALKWYSVRGYSANEIQKRLKNRNLGMRRKRILEEVRLAKNVEIKKNRYKYTPKKYKNKAEELERQKEQQMLNLGQIYRVSFIIEDIPVHSRPWKRNYLGFRIQAFHINPKILNNKRQDIINKLIELTSKYLGYNVLDWENYDAYPKAYLGEEYPNLIMVSNAIFLNGRWIFRVEREGRELKSSSGLI